MGEGNDRDEKTDVAKKKKRGKGDDVDDGVLFLIIMVVTIKMKQFARKGI